MPRLTDQDYLRNHDELQQNRARDDAVFVLLSASEQWDLFAYYLPHETSTPASLLAHRKQLLHLDPSLAQRAGRAMKRLHRLEERLPAYREHMATAPRTKKNTQKKIVIFSEVRPQLDPKQFARIIVQAAEEQVRRERAAATDAPTTPESELHVS